MEEGRRFKKPVKQKNKKKKNNNRRKRKGRVVVAFLIIAMLCAIGVSAEWLIQRGINFHKRNNMLRSIMISGGMTVNSCIINTTEKYVWKLPV